MKLLTVQRRESIKAMLLEKESITVREVMETYDVSVETVRRDFDALAGEGFLNKIYGGATLKKRTSDVPRELSDQIFSEEKERVAARAVRFMKPGDTIFMDHSNYVFRMCKGLTALNMEFTVLTNSLQVLNELSKCPKIRLIAVGGRYDANEQAFLGPTASGFLQQFQVDRAFFSCKSFDMKRGLSVADERVADMLRTVIACADQPCLLAEHSMFGKASFAWFGSFDDIRYVFTDRKIDDNWRNYFSRKHVRLYECIDKDRTDEPDEDDVEF